MYQNRTERHLTVFCIDPIVVYFVNVKANKIIFPTTTLEQLFEKHYKNIILVKSFQDHCVQPSYSLPQIAGKSKIKLNIGFGYYRA